MRLLDASAMTSAVTVPGASNGDQQEQVKERGSGPEKSTRLTSIPNPSESRASSLTRSTSAAARQGSGSDGDSDPDENSQPANPSSKGALRHRSSPSSNTLSALLEPFNSLKNNGKIPERSRAGADIAEQKTANGIGLLDSWKYLPFLAHQATSLASAFVSHHVFGPPKKSWGIELTLFTTAVRESVQYSHLSSLDQLRKFLNLGQILPTPRDGVVTPVTFQVKKRGLKGLLEEADNNEDGKRELTGEWVVSKRIWRRMQHEHYGRHLHPHRHASNMSKSSSSSSATSRSTSALRQNSDTQATSESQKQSQSSNSTPSSGKDKVVLYLHGGAYYVMSAATHRFVTISLSKYTDCRVFAVNYRLAPETRWPGQIHDAVSAYMRLIMDLKIAPDNIIIAGDSAGGGLCLATLMYLRDNGYPLPCGAIVMSPWVDLTMSCDSWETNAPYDYLRMPSGDDHMNPIASYLGAENVKSLITHPYVSPLFGDFTGFPPMLIQCGDAECLRDEGTLLAHKASLAGVQVYHEVYEDCPHVFQAFFFLEAAKKAFRSHRNFVKRVLPLGTTSKSDLLKSTSIIDKEVMSDAHAIKADGEPEKECLSPQSDTTSRASLDGVFGGSSVDGDFSIASESSADGKADDDVSGYQDSDDELVTSVVGEKHTKKRTPFKHPKASLNSASAESSEQEMGEKDQQSAGEGDPASDNVLRGIGGMINLASKVSPAQHHDLDRVDEEQDESIAASQSHDDNVKVTDYVVRTQPNHSSSASLGKKTDGSFTAPSSPSAFKYRHRSLSSLSITSITPTANTPGISSTSPVQYFQRLSGHSRSNSINNAGSHSTYHATGESPTKPGLFRQNSRPKARNNSHPDLQALLDSYDANPSHHTILWRTDQTNDDNDPKETQAQPGESTGDSSASGSEGETTPTSDIFDSIDAIEELDPK